MGHGQGRQPRNEWTGWDTIQRAAERVAHEDVVRRGGLEVSEACRNRALRVRDMSRAQATDTELKSCDVAFFCPKGIRASFERKSSGLRLKLSG